jgi:hypothetical protein
MIGLAVDSRRPGSRSFDALEPIANGSARRTRVSRAPPVGIPTGRHRAGGVQKVAAPFAAPSPRRA